MQSTKPAFLRGASPSQKKCLDKTAPSISDEEDKCASKAGDSAVPSSAVSEEAVHSITSNTANEKPTGVESSASTLPVQPDSDPGPAALEAQQQCAELGEEDARIAAVAAAQAEAEAAARKARGNGKVQIIYERYDEYFDIKDGMLTAEVVDELYCFSFVMPKCIVHLCEYPPEESRMFLVQGRQPPYVPENPPGTFCTLETGRKYWAYVIQDAEQLKAEIERNRAAFAGGHAGGNKDGIVRDDGRVFESCSCIYGAPCCDEYGCRDWHNRFAVAQQNGWKGF
jgi:hypothetical protein